MGNIKSNIIDSFPMFRPVHCATPVIIKNPKFLQYLNSGFKVYDRENKIFVSFDDVVDFIRPSFYSVFEYLDWSALHIPKNVYIKDFSFIGSFNVDTDYLVCDIRTQQYFKSIKRYYYCVYLNSIEYLCTRYYFVDSSNNVIDPCFIPVACNKCLICNRKKINKISQMTLFQTEECKYLPFFVTLTYNKDTYKDKKFSCKYKYVDDDNKLKIIDRLINIEDAVNISSIDYAYNNKLLRCLVVDELQRFLKRLRIGLHRAGFDVKLKYYFVSEIGKRGRLHYHGLIWLCPETPSEILNKLYTYNLYYVNQKTEVKNKFSRNLIDILLKVKNKEATTDYQRVNLF